MVPQNWIIDCLKTFKISDKVIKFIENAMKNRRVELTTGGKSLTEVKIQRERERERERGREREREIFQGYAQADTNFINRKRKQPPHLYGRHQTVCQK